MSSVLEPPPATPAEPPEGAAPVAVERPCTTCGAPLAEAQDWCLECGSAQPGRLGGKPGWRAALTVLGVTGLLAVGAGAAAYAALDSEATREATAQAPPPATPTQPAPPTATAETTPTTPPAETTPTDTVDPPESDPADVPEPSGSADAVPAPTPSPSPTPAPVTPSTPSTGSGGSDTGSGGGDTGSSEPEPVAIELKGDDMGVYDPYKRGGTQSPGDPADAVDGKRDTAWSVNVGPDGEVRMGLVVSLEKAQKLGDLELRADTPGFTVETYATRSSEVPPDVLDARWKHLDDARDVGVRETLELDGEYRHVLLWITSQPADTKVAIPEIELFQQED